jgi:hypothetical protein
MNEREYQVAADIVRKVAEDELRTGIRTGHHPVLANAFTRFFAADDPEFDDSRFFRACLPRTSLMLELGAEGRLPARLESERERLYRRATETVRLFAASEACHDERIPAGAAQIAASAFASVLDESRDFSPEDFLKACMPTPEDIAQMKAVVPTKQKPGFWQRFTK